MHTTTFNFVVLCCSLYLVPGTGTPASELATYPGSTVSSSLYNVRLYIARQAHVGTYHNKQEQQTSSLNESPKHSHDFEPILRTQCVHA